MAASRTADAAGEIEILLAAKTPDKIPYSDTPLCQPGAKIIYLTHDEFKRKFACQYSESIHGNKKILPECTALLFGNWPSTVKPRIAAEIRERLEQPLDGLVICKIDDRYVLMTSRMIRAKTLVAFYAGEIKAVSDIKISQDNYHYDLTTPAMQKSIYVATPDKIGGLGRFMQHLPEKPTSKGEGNELAEVIFTNPQTKVAYENIDTVLVDYEGVPLILMYAAEDIEAGQQLGYSFGQKYWRVRNERPRYFTPAAELIPLSDYYYKNDRGGVTLYLRDTVKNNPELVYEEAVDLYGRRKKYEHALAAFQFSSQLFAKKHPEGSIDVAKCLSGMASCYRELKNIPKAIEACELAIQVFYNNKFQDMGKIYAKYENCLEQSGKSLEELFDYGTSHFGKKNFILTVRINEYLLKRYKQEKGDHRLDIALCHSALSSCYVGLNELETAIHHCRTALEIRKSIPDLSLQSKIIEENEYKLVALEKLVIARRRMANPRT